MNTRTTALTALAFSPLLMAASCMPTPGWKGEGTIIELEHLTPEREGAGIESDGLEVTVLLDNGQEGNAMFAPTDKCEDALTLGQTITLPYAINACGPADFSDDD